MWAFPWVPSRLLQPSQRLLAAGLGLIGFGLLLRFPVKYALGTPFLMDYNVYRFAAELLRTGQGHLLYEVAYGEGMLFRYAPIWAVIWSPLGYLSTHAGAVLWGVSSVLWVVISLWCAARIALRLGFPLPVWAPIMALGLLSRPLLEEFGNGQADLWWLGVTSLFLWFELTDRPQRAALCLALSIALKLTSVVFLPYLFLKGRPQRAWQALGWLAVVLIAGAVAADPTHPPNVLLGAWANSLAHWQPQLSFRIGDQSLLACLSRFLTADGYGLNLLSLSRGHVLALTLMVELMLFGVVLWPLRSTDGSVRRFLLDAGMLMIFMVFASPSGWLSTYTVLLLPLTVAIGATSAWLTRRPRDIGTWALMLAIGGFSVTMRNKFWQAIGIRYWHTEAYVYLVFMIAPLFALSLFGLLWRLRRNLASSTDQALP